MALYRVDVTLESGAYFELAVWARTVDEALTYAMQKHPNYVSVGACLERRA